MGVVAKPTAGVVGMVGCTVQGTINTPGTIAKAVKKPKKKKGETDEKGDSDDEEEKKDDSDQDQQIADDQSLTAATANFATHDYIGEDDLATQKDFRTDSLQGVNPKEIQKQIE